MCTRVFWFVLSVWQHPLSETFLVQLFLPKQQWTNGSLNMIQMVLICLGGLLTRLAINVHQLGPCTEDERYPPTFD